MLYPYIESRKKSFSLPSPSALNKIFLIDEGIDRLSLCLIQFGVVSAHVGVGTGLFGDIFSHSPRPPGPPNTTLSGKDDQMIEEEILCDASHERRTRLHLVDGLSHARGRL